MCLQAQGGMPAVREFVQSLEAPRLDGLDICEYVTYFQNRYYEEGEPTHRYHHLHLERSGNPTEVDEMLCGATQTKADTLIGCLGIVLRYRNNLFHGEKWAYHLHEQENNFRYSSALFQHIMDRVT